MRQVGVSLPPEPIGTGHTLRDLAAELDWKDFPSPRAVTADRRRRREAGQNLRRTAAGREVDESVRWSDVSGDGDERVRWSEPGREGDEAVRWSEEGSGSSTRPTRERARPRPVAAVVRAPGGSDVLLAPPTTAAARQGPAATAWSDVRGPLWVGEDESAEIEVGSEPEWNAAPDRPAVWTDGPRTGRASSQTIRHPASEGVPGRRTITITGRGAERDLTWTAHQSRRRPTRRPHERDGFKPDRAAMWAFLLGILLVLIAATSSHAAVRQHFSAGYGAAFARPVAAHVVLTSRGTAHVR